MRYYRRTLPKNVVIVGGGLAGLAAAIYLARGGRTVTVFEKRRYLGGRAVTHLRHGYRFNLGAHALYRTGAAASVLRELSIPVRGRVPKQRGAALLNGEEYRLPVGFFSLLATGALPLRAKLEAVRLLVHIRMRDGARAESMSVREWLDRNVRHPRARAFMSTLIRVATYTADESQSAALALAQARIALRGVLYIDEGWQKLVDGLHSAAVTSGVNFVTSSRIVGVHHEDGAVRAIELGGLELDADRTDTLSIALPETQPDDVQGARIPADTVLLAVDPVTAADMVGAEVAKSWAGATPVTAACLDVALRELPERRRTFALGLDEPLYLSVHSAFAQLTPRGGALVHTLKYQTGRSASDVEIDGERARRGAPEEDERRLEDLLDRIQPGWREVLVHRRFLPAMTVSNAMPLPGAPRPSPRTAIGGLYVAGDWVGSEGLLSDAALASAREAAKSILSTD